MIQQGGMKKLRLRRINNSAEPSVIQKNLEPLKQNSLKKKMAQDMYYSAQTGVSPLVRNTNKNSVHERLGVKQLTSRRKNKVPVVGTNTISIMPKRRTLNRVNFNKQQRIFSAQERLNRIRSMQAQQMQSGDKGMRKTIRLRKAVKNSAIPEATNLTVQVKNNIAPGITNNGIRNYAQNLKRFRMRLNPALQAQIRVVQAEYVGHQQILHMRVTPVSTSVMMHERFASYS